MVAIVSSRIDPRALEAEVASPQCGAIVTFVGTVRASASDGRPVSGLSYEAYEPLVVAECEAILAEARRQFGTERAALVHRAGNLAVGDVAVAVVVAAAHRAAAFAACAYVIDEVKARAAIWKKEHYVDGASEWIANCDAFNGGTADG